ncbi:MAG TPA: UDP-4-amino-4,6-dideoxy-N-acetyl-beta-L-altrosamine transaminase [Anaerolineae bacterium]|nr:UDP-4-amino-4,6-dideoxy-N-acetyl-beta-L-altrosamine transaminase [Anaerolineae bacterium]
MSDAAQLALHGGTPVRATLLPYGHQQIEEDDIAAVVAVLRSDWLTTGPNVEEFERAVADWIGARFAVVFSSGTAALHGAVFAAGLGEGDQAITSPLTFAATANCLVYQGATPVFADVCEDTLTIDPNEIAKRITPRTKAILPVDYAGHPADLDAIRELAGRHNLIVIEDAAHALGATYCGKRVGTLSEMTMFSFHPVKHITTGEGGVITTNDAVLAERMKLFRNHGINSDARKRQEAGGWFYEMVALGYNYRLTDIGCVLGLSQLKRLDANVARRRAIAAQYTDAFSRMPGIVPPFVRSGVEPAWHLYPIRIDRRFLTVDRAEIFRALRAENLGVNVHYIPVHQHPYYRERFGYRGGEYPNAETAYESLISLPMFHGMTDQDVADVIRAVEKVVNAFGVR